MGCGSGIEFLCEFRLLTQQDAERVLVGIPVLDLLTGHTALDGGLSHCRRHLGDESRIDGLWNEVVASEGEVVHMIDIIDHIRHGLLGQVGNGMYGSQFHLLVDGLGMHVESTAEDIGEADYIVYLVGIVGTTC